jgi:hypothetical protein
MLQERRVVGARTQGSDSQITALAGLLAFFNLSGDDAGCPCTFKHGHLLLRIDHVS